MMAANRDTTMVSVQVELHVGRTREGQDMIERHGVEIESVGDMHNSSRGAYVRRHKVAGISLVKKSRPETVTDRNRP